MKLGDFGVAGMIKPDEMDKSSMFTTMAGTRMFIAPEVYEHAYTFVADVYSLGITAIQMAEGIPRHSFSQSGWTREFHDFVRVCTLSVEERPQLSEIKKVSNVE